MHSFQKFIVVSFPTTLPLYRNKDMEISCESAGSLSHRLIREFGNRQRRRPKTKSLIGVVYKSAHTLLDFNCLLKYQSFI